MPEVPQEELDKYKAAVAEAAALKQQADAAGDYKRDMLKFKDEATARAAELQKIKDDQAAVESKRLAEQGQFKLLAEQNEAKAAKAEQEKAEALGKVDRFLKQTKLESAATAAGLLPTALVDLRGLDLEGLKIRTGAGGVIEVDGVDTVLASLKKDRPHWFGTGERPAFNGGGGGGGSAAGDKELSTAEFLELQKKDPAKAQAYLAEQFKKKKEAAAAKK